MAKLTPSSLKGIKAQGQKLMAAVCYDTQIATILDQAGVDIISAGDSGGRSAFGHKSALMTTVDEMVIIGRAVSAGVEHAVINCDMPFGPTQEGWQSALKAAVRFVKEANAEMVKIDNAAANMDTVNAIVQAGIPIWPQFGFSPQATMAIGDFMSRTEDMIKQARDMILKQAQMLEEAGAACLDLTGVTHDVYAEVQALVKIPVLGGQAGAEADGRIFTGFSPRAAGVNQDPSPTNIGRFIYDAAKAQLEKVRAADF
jgi:3-methyl-2-oxobutanoate hydroxymethyltransferase